MQSLLKFIGFGSISQDAHPVELQQDFIEHISTYGLTYGTAEEFAFRMNLYAQKDARLNEINAREKNFWVAHNHMSTWTDQEYKKLLGYRGQQGEAEKNYVHIETEGLQDIDYVDWRLEGAVNVAKNQGQCGSCWAFSATAAVESAHFLKHQELLNLSEQELVDCDTTSHGCEGGWQSHAFKYLESHMQQTELSYPYSSSEGRSGTCDYDTKTKSKVEVASYVNVPKNSPDQLRAAIMKQPVSVSIEADTDVFQHYAGGVFDSKDCGTKLDHAVTAVGFGGNNNPPNYYIIRNSWGSGWGEDGYIKISSDTDGEGICGVQKEALYPLMK